MSEGDHGSEIHTAWEVRCMSGFGRAEGEGYCPAEPSVQAATEAEAVAAWNTRARPALGEREITDEMVEAAAKAFSGAPFPSRGSITRARAALTAALTTSTKGEDR